MHLVDQTPVEYFREHVEVALTENQIKASELTRYYIVNMLCSYVKPEAAWLLQRSESDCLALRLKSALEHSGSEQRLELRLLGDTTLFISGFFPDSVHRSLTDVDYYIAMGRYAYGVLSLDQQSRFPQVYAELARKFVPMTDVLAYVSERSSVTRNSTIMRLYEKWLRTGSQRAGKQLVDRGIVPNASIGKRFIQ